MRARAVVLAVAIVLGAAWRFRRRPGGVVEKGFNPEEDEAIKEIIGAFEQKLVSRSSWSNPRRTRCSAKSSGVRGRGRPTSCSALAANAGCSKLAHEDQLVDLKGVLGDYMQMRQLFAFELETSRQRLLCDIGAYHPERTDVGGFAEDARIGPVQP